MKLPLPTQAVPVLRATLSKDLFTLEPCTRVLLDVWPFAWLQEVCAAKGARTLTAAQIINPDHPELPNYILTSRLVFHKNHHHSNHSSLAAVTDLGKQLGSGPKAHLAASLTPPTS